MLDSFELALENSVLTNIFYGSNINLDDFFVRYGAEHFTDSNQMVYSAAKELWASNKSIHPSSLKMLLPDCSATIDELYEANAIEYGGYEHMLLSEANRKRAIKFLKESLYNLETKREVFEVGSEKIREYLEKVTTSGFVSDDPKTIYEIMQEDISTVDVAPVSLSFIQDIFSEDGGFEYGQLVTITGEQEAGKTQLLNQILFGFGSMKIPSLYFSLEFNKRSFQKYMRKKFVNNGIDMEATKHIRFLSDEDTTGSIFEIENMIRRYHKKYNTRIVAIDSQMMLDAEGIDGDRKSVSKSEEAMITKIYRTLHRLCNKLDILIFVIAQGSKEDNKSKRVEIFGSKRASHLARIMFHMEKEFSEPEQQDGAKQAGAGTIEVIESYFLRVAKNKQTGKHPRVNLNFDKLSLEFWTKPEDKASGWFGNAPQVIHYDLNTSGVGEHLHQDLGSFIGVAGTEHKASHRERFFNGHPQDIRESIEVTPHAKREPVDNSIDTCFPDMSFDDLDNFEQPAVDLFIKE